ncbi:hypothetical protein OAM56_02990 [Alphaproteobacteria bacterium]|nr:hypothetical protein [Alphaproteobacteria bacterium]
MKDFNKTYNEELFPELSSYNRAVNYPYFAPNYPFSFYKGRFIKDICFNLENRIPILSVGSNRSPYQLKRKFSLDEDICVTPAKLFDSDIVYAASISAYGSLPATQWPSDGTVVDLNVLWLKEEQLNIMHLTEAVGIAYHFVKLQRGSVKFTDFQYSNDVYGYVSVAGVLPFNESVPKRLSSIYGLKTKLDSIDEYEALSFTMNNLENKKQSLEQWLTKVIDNQKYRFKVHENLKTIALKPKKPNWKVIKIKANGELII